MPMEAAPILAWTFVSEIPIPEDLGPILVAGEQPVDHMSMAE